MLTTKAKSGDHDFLILGAGGLPNAPQRRLAILCGYLMPRSEDLLFCVVVT